MQIVRSVALHVGTVLAAIALREFAQAAPPQAATTLVLPTGGFDPTRYGGEGFGRNPDHDRLTLRA